MSPEILSGGHQDWYDWTSCVSEADCGYSGDGLSKALLMASEDD